MSFVQPSCMRCNEHNKQGRLHSRLMQLSQRRRRSTLKRTGSTAKASKCFGAVISCPELPKETELCTLLYKPAKTCALFADSLAVPLSYRCSTRSKASVRKLCLLPTVLNDIRLSSRSCFRSFERKILRSERLSSLVLVAGRWVDKFEQQCQRNGPISMHETACMAFSLLPFALVGRRIFPTTVDFCRPLPFPSSLIHSL